MKKANMSGCNSEEMIKFKTYHKAISGMNELIQPHQLIRILNSLTEEIDPVMAVSAEAILDLHEDFLNARIYRERYHAKLANAVIMALPKIKTAQFEKSAQLEQTA